MKSEESPSQEQNQKIEPLDSTEMSLENSALPPAENHVPILLHRTCKTISVYAFKEATCNGDLSYLIIQGEPSQEQLIEALMELVFDWATLIKNKESEYIAELRRKIGLLEHAIVFIDYAVECIRDQVKYRCVDFELIDEVNSYGYSLSYKPTEEELDMVKNLATTLVFDHSEYVDEYNALNKTATGKKQTEEEFMRTIAVVSRFLHTHINMKQVMADEFASYFNLFLEEQDQLQKLVANGR